MLLIQKQVHDKLVNEKHNSFTFRTLTAKNAKVFAKNAKEK